MAHRLDIVRRAARLGLAVGCSLLIAAPATGHGDLDHQIEQLDAAHRRAPLTPDERLRRAGLLAETGRFDAALAELDRAEAAGADGAALEAMRAAALEAAGCTGAALGAADRALAADPFDPHALELRARLLARLGQPADALAAYDRLLHAGPKPRPHHFLEAARAAEAAGDPNAALVRLDEGLARLGSVATLALRAVELERQAGRPDHALGRLDALIAAHPAQPQWMVERARLLEALGRHDEAAASLRQARAWIDGLSHGRDQIPAMRRLRAKVDQRLAALQKPSHTSRHTGSTR